LPRLNGPLVVTSLCWGFNFVSIKLLYQQMTPPAVALVRFLLMWGALVLICRLWRVDTRIEKADLWRTLFAGAVSMGFYMILFLYGMSLTSPAEGAILLATAPILTYLFSVIIRVERFEWWALVGTGIAFGGVTMVILGGHAAGSGSLTGNLFVFASAILWAVSVLMMRPLLVKYQPLPVLTRSMPGALIPLLIFGFRDSIAIRPLEWNWVTWANLTQVVLGSGLIGFLGIYRGVREVGPAIATRYQLMVPVIAAFFGWVVYHQELVTLQWLGLAVVLGGIALAAWARSRTNQPEVVSNVASKQ